MAYEDPPLALLDTQLGKYQPRESPCGTAGRPSKAINWGQSPGHVARELSKVLDDRDNDDPGRKGLLHTGTHRGVASACLVAEVDPDGRAVAGRRRLVDDDLDCPVQRDVDQFGSDGLTQLRQAIMAIAVDRLDAVPG